jgi:hypothetical protein
VLLLQCPVVVHRHWLSAAAKRSLDGGQAEIAACQETRRRPRGGGALMATIYGVASRKRYAPSICFIETLPADMAWWRWAAVEILRQERRLHPHERKFAATMVEWDGRPSQAQVDWLAGLHARLYGGVPA